MPGVALRIPANAREWLLIAGLGAAGFVGQFLLTAALSVGKGGGSKALNFVYIQTLYALGFDLVVFGTRPGWTSAAGGALILGSAVWVAVKKEKHGPRKEERRGGDGGGDEELGLIEGHDHNETR